MKLFQQVPGAKVGRSVFNLSYDKKMTADMGKLYPILAEEAVPGDVWSIGYEAVLRAMPLVAPVLHQIDVFVEYFFCPYRLLDDEWEDFITGGVDGDDTTELTRWEATSTTLGGIWDYLGFPVGIDPDGAYPLHFPFTAYYTIYNQYYRDQNVDVEASLTGTTLVRRRWAKDYFTSALPWQQRGTAPALPISGSTSALFEYTSGDPSGTSFTLGATNATGSVSGYQVTEGTAQSLANNTVDLSAATTFDVADLRLAFQIQKWMERNARSGARYTEFLRAHFGVAPRDERLDRMEFLGGGKAPVIMSEVLQTSETSTTPQGTLAGHGIAVDKRFVAKYRVKEFGVIMGLLSIVPKPAYASQGINRQWLRETRYDFYSPEFANLSEQAILRAELYASATESENVTVFGYQGRYDEMRVKHSMICGHMRTTFDHWHLAREFSSAPTLNTSFVQCAPDDRIFADGDEPEFVVNFGNIIKAVRPLPYMSQPGLIDH